MPFGFSAKEHTVIAQYVHNMLYFVQGLCTKKKMYDFKRNMYHL